MDDQKQIRGIVRLMATDINGNLSVKNSLRRVKGISFMFANLVFKQAKIDSSRKLGSLSDEELKILENVIRNPVKIPWMLNRCKDVIDNKDKHLIGTDIELRKREDINLLKKLRAYKGIRHELGQPVRGQRTRSTFRVNKSVGVSRRKQQPAKRARQ
ncbi:MAG: 30S ribosomal protein S13 [Candidatus Aenigmarchaeota archaeon]|nr:30S ribosomal protein S13 [Candidatus Aenigmarchaeota archaeon]